MAFLATNQGLADAYSQIKRIAAAIQTHSDNLIVSSAAGDISALRIVNSATNLRGWRAELVELASTPGLQAYAKTQEDEPTYDVAAEYLAMRGKVDDVITWIVANIPTSSGYMIVQTMESDGSITTRTFTPAQTAGFRTVLQALSDSIE